MLFEENITFLIGPNNKARSYSFMLKRQNKGVYTNRNIKIEIESRATEFIS